MTPHDHSRSSIGIFDSGFGGLTVMRAIRAQLPYENIIYFGDTARLPYGNKSPDTILRYSQENAKFLSSLGIKILVVACHTASSIAIHDLRQSFTIPIIGIVEQGVEELARTYQAGHVAVLGTRATISSGIYEKHLHQLIPSTHVSHVPCPLFVPLVEEGFINHPLTDLAVQESLKSLKDKRIHAVLLGCTHYPLLNRLIQKELGPDVSLIDPANTCATKVKQVLTEHQLLNASQESPCYTFYVSDDPEKFRRYGELFLGHPIEDVLIKPCA